MGIAYNTSIVRDGLVLHLDAANVKSYTGSGTVWKDVSGNGNNATLNNGVAFSSSQGTFVFDGVNDTASASSDVYNFGSNNFTFSVWINTQVSGYPTTSQQRILDQSYAGQINCPFNILTSGVLNFRIIDVIAGHDFQLLSTYTIQPNMWYNCVVSRNGNTWSMYVNKELVKTGTSSYPYPWRSYVPMSIGYYTEASASYFNGYISNVMIYKNRGLLENEIKQNFEALRGRYGI